MKFNWKRLGVIASAMIVCVFVACTFTACMGFEQADTVKHNIQVDADNFRTFRRMTFVDLYTGERLYMAEGYFSLQSTYENAYQGQQEIGLVFKIGEGQYKMDYFGLGDHVTYVIEQVENTSTNPYFWKITWYVPLPVVANP